MTLATTAHAQLSDGERHFILSEVARAASSLTGQVRTFDERYEGVRGTPLLFDNWVSGRVMFMDDQVLEYDSVFNIDAVNSEILILLPSGNAVSVRTKRIREAVLNIDEQSHQFVPVVADRVTRLAENDFVLLEKLDCGDKIALYRWERKQFREADYKGGYSAERPYDEYLAKAYYFFRIDGVFHEIKLKRRSVVKTLEGVMPDVGKRLQERRFTVQELCGWLRRR